MSASWRAVGLVAAMGVGLAGAGLAAGQGAAPTMPWKIGGPGAAYLLVEPGELEIELYKQDLGRRHGGTDVRAVLAGPDREVLAETVLPGAGGSAGSGPGPVQRAVLRTPVEHGGVFVLSLTGKGDRYGVDLAWGIRTNAAAYVVETARGHRDERHEEPIVLLEEDLPADVVFWPRRGAFGIEVEGLPEDVDALALFDEHDRQVAAIEVLPERRTRLREVLGVPADTGPQGAAAHTLQAEPDRGGPWRLHLPRGRAYVGIDGVTRWESSDPYRDQAVWTPDPDAWFPFPAHRWLVSPYQRTLWVAAETSGSVSFRVHNNGLEPESVDLRLTCDGDPARPALPRGGVAWLPSLFRPPAGTAPPPTPATPWTARLSESAVALEAGRSEAVSVAYDGLPPGQTRRCRVRATPRLRPELSTYATLTLRVGVAPAAAPLDVPLVLRPYAHENRQLGYLPDYPVDAQPYFDLENRPHVVASGTLHRGDPDGWRAISLRDAVVRRVPEFTAGSWSVVSSKIAFDADGHLYLLARSGAAVALLHSTDRGDTFTAYVLAGRETEPRTWDLESFGGCSAPAGPPSVVRYTRTAQSEDTSLRWRSVNDLDLFVTDKAADGSLVVRDPVRLTDSALGISMHSGIPATVASRGSKVHVVWGEATDPDADPTEIPGVPAYAATYDRVERSLGAPAFLDFGPPPNDAHNTPSLVLDGGGTLHVVVGTHGQPFRYRHSLAPNDAHAGWSPPETTREVDLRQTYVGLACGGGDALHLVFRQWRSGEAYLDGATWAALAYQRRPAGGPWQPERVLVAPPLSEYSIYYHRLTVDRAGALYVSYDYWSTMWSYRNDARGPVAAGSGRPGSGWGRAVLVSRDGGSRWSMW